MSVPAAYRPLAESLDLVAREVTDLVAVGDQLQDLISRLVAAAGASDPSAMVEAQAADLLSQRLSGLAAFVRALAEAAPLDASADIDGALRLLTLTEQARRLSNPTSPPAVDAGEALTFWD
jgi:Lon protease-like protein